MAVFKTSDGRDWIVRLDAMKIRDVRESCDVDLGTLDFAKVAERLGSDPVLLADVLWALCQDAAAKGSIQKQQFYEGLVGDAIDDAARALLQARADFSPARTRSLIQRQIETSDRIRAKMAAAAMAKMDDSEGRLEAAMMARLQAEMEEALTRFESASSLPAASG